MVRQAREDRSQRDHYAVLGVPATASQNEIERAYRSRARATHPDVNTDDPSAEAHFEELVEAREVLGDPAARKVYDKLRDARTEPTTTRPRPRPSGRPAPASPPIPVLGHSRRSRPSGPSIRPGPVVWRPSRVGRS